MKDFDKKASLVMRMFYESLGIEVIKEAPDRVFDDWDRILKIGEKTYKVEEKARRGNYNDVLIEIIEDLKTGDLGWFYQTKADKLVYSFFNDSGTEPKKIYLFEMNKLKEYFNKNARLLIRNCNLSPKGYGLTLNVFLPLTLGKQIYNGETSGVTDRP